MHGVRMVCDLKPSGRRVLAKVMPEQALHSIETKPKPVWGGGCFLRKQVPPTPAVLLPLWLREVVTWVLPTLSASADSQCEEARVNHSVLSIAWSGASQARVASPDPRPIAV